jgi:hypothetical protein
MYEYIVYLHIYFPPISKSRYRVFTVFKLVSLETTEVKNLVAKLAKFPKKEFLNGIFSRGPGHKLESSQTQVLSAFLRLFFCLQMIFTNRREFSCFVDFFVCIFKTKAESSIV